MFICISFNCLCNARKLIQYYSLLQEPFKYVPVIWIIHEKSLALRLSKYAANGQNQLISDWKQVFNRATVVVFPTHSLPVTCFAMTSSLSLRM